MRPEVEKRRTVIREWMSLPHQQRQTGEQATAFAAKAIDKFGVKGTGDRQQRILTWLQPRIGKA